MISLSSWSDYEQIASGPVARSPAFFSEKNGAAPLCRDSRSHLFLSVTWMAKKDIHNSCFGLIKKMRERVGGGGGLRRNSYSIRLFCAIHTRDCS